MRPSILGVLLSPHRMDAQFRAKRWHYIGPVGVAGALAFAAARDFRSRRRAWALAAMASGLVMMAYGAPGAAAQDGSQWRADVGSGQAKFGWAHPDAYLGDDEFSGPFLLCDEPGKTVSLIVPVEGLPGGKTLALHLVRGSETVKLVAEVGPNEESVEAKIGPSHPVYGLFHGTGTLTAQVSGKPKETYSLASAPAAFAKFAMACHLSGAVVMGASEIEPAQTANPDDLIYPPLAKGQRLPRFSDYSVRVTYDGRPALPQFDGRDRAYRSFRTRIRKVLQSARSINFAGQYFLVEIGMTGGSQVYIIDARTGRIVLEKLYAYQYSTITFDPQSRLLLVDWANDEECYLEGHLFNGSRLTQVFGVHRGSQPDCMPDVTSTE